jgi:hypothetical protein
MSEAFDLNGVFNEVVTRLEDSGTADREAYYDLVEEVLEEKRSEGWLTDDDDIEEMEQDLKLRWPDAQVALENRTNTDQE